MTDDDAKNSNAADQQNQGEPGAEQVPKQARKQRMRGRFRKGQSGNPSGRRRGRVSKQTIAALVKAYGSPLEFLLQTMSDESAKMVDRIEAAKAAIGYVNRRLPEYADNACPPLEEPSKAEIARIEAWQKQQAELAPRAAPGSHWPALML